MSRFIHRLVAFPPNPEYLDSSKSARKGINITHHQPYSCQLNKFSFRSYFDVASRLSCFDCNLLQIMNGPIADSADELVELNTLCRSCERICQQARILLKSMDASKTLSTQHIFKHHQTSRDLEASAGRGCHMCNLLLSILDPYLILLRAIETSLQLPRSRKIKRRKTSYVIKLRMASSRKITGLPHAYLFTILFKETQSPRNEGTLLFTEPRNHSLASAEKFKDVKTQGSMPKVVIWYLKGE